jgi:single-strand selective monofunctional uracil DNA glycosylase
LNGQIPKRISENGLDTRSRAGQFPPVSTAAVLLRAARQLARELQTLRFSRPVGFVYHPLDYAWAAHREYLTRYANGPKRVLLLGMNPGPFGMAQTGVPFGEVAAVRDWLGIHAPVRRPEREHPARPVLGFDCPRSEVSGRRLWGLMAARFGTAENFFADHFVANYCPLLFIAGAGAKNLTPDKLTGSVAQRMFALCDAHLATLVRTLRVEVAVGIGGFAEERLRAVCGPGVRVGRMLHPSPASPAANRDWAGTATRQMRELGVWN